MVNILDPKESRRQFRVTLGEALKPYDLHGLGVFIPTSTKNIMEAAEKMHKELNEWKEENK